MKRNIVIPILLVSLAIVFFLVGRALRAFWIRRVVAYAARRHPMEGEVMA